MRNSIFLATRVMALKEGFLHDMESRPKNLVYTIGHSNHPNDYFIELLKPFSISCIIDVRSVPASSYNPQFNLENLQYSLKTNNIKYLHFGEEFGARHTDSELFYF